MFNGCRIKNEKENERIIMQRRKFKKMNLNTQAHHIKMFYTEMHETTN